MENEKNIWYQISVEVDPVCEEAVLFAFNQLDSLGTEINDFGKQKTDHIFVIGYFNELPDEEILRETLEKSLQIYDFPADIIESIETNEIENQDWLAEWKKYWKPTETDKFIIAPPWENVENSSKIIVKIEPNMAFGTGTHETTRLCLKSIEENYQPEMSFFDVGTGTGILSIAVAKLRKQWSVVGGRWSESRVQSSEIEKIQPLTQDSRLTTQDSFLACDIDKDAVRIAIENARLNDTEEIEFFVGSITESSPNFDFVCANVTADKIIKMLPLLVKKSKKLLLLSGILAEQENLLVNKLKEFGIEHPEIETEGEWISILVRFQT